MLFSKKKHTQKSHLLAERVTEGTPLDGIDLVLADLDGVVYTGDAAIEYAVASLTAAG